MNPGFGLAMGRAVDVTARASSKLMPRTCMRYATTMEALLDIPWMQCTSTRGGLAPSVARVPASKCSWIRCTAAGKCAPIVSSEMSSNGTMMCFTPCNTARGRGYVWSWARAGPARVHTMLWYGHEGTDLIADMTSVIPFSFSAASFRESSKLPRNRPGTICRRTNHTSSPKR